MVTFDDVVSEIISEHEKGYADDPTDRGGETKYGISKASYPGEDIKNLTPDRARFLYKRDFWGPAACDALPSEMRFHVFDFAINSGVAVAVKELQRCLGVLPDGKIGPITLTAISSSNIKMLLVRYWLRRLKFMRNAPTWRHHNGGWVNRMIYNLERILA